MMAALDNSHIVALCSDDGICKDNKKWTFMYTIIHFIYLVRVLISFSNIASGFVFNKAFLPVLLHPCRKNHAKISKMLVQLYIYMYIYIPD